MMKERELHLATPILCPPYIQGNAAIANLQSKASLLYIAVRPQSIPLLVD